MAWLAVNNSSDWTIDIKLVKFQKNSAHQSGINCTPYSTMFSSEARIGIMLTCDKTQTIHKKQQDIVSYTV